MWTGNGPNCGAPHGGEALKPGMRVLGLRCRTPFPIPPPPASRTDQTTPVASRAPSGTVTMQ